MLVTANILNRLNTIEAIHITALQEVAQERRELQPVSTGRSKNHSKGLSAEIIAKSKIRFTKTVKNSL